MTLADRIERALDAARPGDVTIMVRAELRRGAVSESDLRRALLGVRDVMAFGACEELCELVLRVMPDAAWALELAAMASARLDPADRERPMALLHRALSSRSIEAPALLGSVHKRAWRQAWYESRSGWMAPESSAENRRRARLAGPHLGAAIAAYRLASERAGAGDYWATTNLATLLTLARHLAVECRFDAVASPEILLRELGELGQNVLPLADRAATVALATPTPYWPLATVAELRLVTDVATDDVEVGPRLVQDLSRALTTPGVRPFMIDSTRQQLRLMLALGYRRASVELGLERLESAWESIVHPEEPAARVVAVAWQDRRAPPPAGGYAAILDQLQRSCGDLVLLLRGGPTDLDLAEVATQLRIPYELFLPCLADEFVASLSEGTDRARFIKAYEGALRLRGSTSFAAVAGQCLGPSFEQADDEELLDWMAACARAYHPSAARALVLGSHPVLPSIAGMNPFVVGTSACDGSVEPRTERSVEQRSLRRGRCRGEVPGMLVGELPYWLQSPFSVALARGDSPEAERWRRYAASSVAQRWLAGLTVRFEAIQALAATGSRRQARPFGFSVLGAGRDPTGALVTYPNLRQATAEVLAPADLDIALLALGLQTISVLRRTIRTKCDVNLDRLFFSLKLSDGILASPLLAAVLERYFNPNLRHTVLFELTPGLVERLRLALLEGNGEVLGTLLDRLHGLVNVHRCSLALDLEAPLPPLLSEVLLPPIGLTTVHVTTTRALLEMAAIHPDQADGVVQQLAMARAGKSPLVVEGVESDLDLDLILQRWPQDGLPIAVRGHRIEPATAVRDALFLPWDTASGYYARPEIVGLLGM